ncbi:hypothetical protein PAXINDRAFT_169741 [Paxillus involutus ATCC 200175]|uniref:Oxidized purine nucleoside triphosphate hydrolase n=1 Tax=Paxillus involutus ATCC 200175 TaxID=664439 RepID=A0A0C9U626_PAXIN|nr:hypothetical protein PAXINDRAFT_169741 [Paxillus involutus ATCC 200175]
MHSDIPPGILLEGDLNPTVFAQGGSEHEWRTFERRRLYTNAFVISGNKLLLGMKKRGFGVGLYNGFGGKVDPGETPAQAAARELQEEAGIDAPLEYAGNLLFLTEGTDWAFDVKIYSAREHSGTPIETDEMRPEWFSLSEDSLYGRTLEVPLDAQSSTSPTDSSLSPADSALPHIPYAKMWADDIYWLPSLVRGQKFVGRADFGEGHPMKRYWFGSVSE